MDGILDQFHTDDFLQRLLQFFMGGQLDKKKSWMDYPSYIPQAGSRHDVLHRSIRDTVSYFTSSIPFLSPMADYIGRGVATSLVGNPRNAYGLPTLLGYMPAGWGGGTASSAFQQALRLNSLRYILLQGLGVSKALRNQYIQDYYNIVYPGDKNAVRRKEAMEAALANPFSLPRVLSFAIDPTLLRKQTRNILDVAANTIQYGMQRDPLNINNTLFAKKAMNVARDIALLASKDPGQYGGFTPAAVTLMANALSKGKDIFLQFRVTGTLVKSQDLDNAAKTFTQKVRLFTQALQPLRDIFGNNILHMADMITTLSGMPIGQMSRAQVLQHATNISNTIRATGLAPAALAPYVAGTRAALRRYLTDSLTSLSALDLGTQLAVLGNSQGPSTMLRSLYIGLITDAYVSGQASLNSRRIAQAYAIAVNLTKTKEDGNGVEKRFTGSLLDFVLKIRTEKDPLKKAMELAGVNTVDQLMRGLGYRLFGMAIKNKALGSLAVLQQYMLQVQTAVMGAAQIPNISSNKDVQDKLINALSDPYSNPLLITKLFGEDGLSLENADDIAMVKKSLGIEESFVANDQAKEAIRLANTVRHLNPRIGARAMGDLRQRRHVVFLMAQRQLRETFKDLDKLPTGGIYTIMSNFINNKEASPIAELKDEKGNVLLNKDQAAAADKYISLFGSQLFDLYSGKDETRRGQIHQAMRNITKALGGNADLALSVMISGASGAFSADPKYKQNLKVLGSTQDKEAPDFKDALDYILSAIYFGDTGNGYKLYQNISNKKKEGYRKAFNESLTAYRTKGVTLLIARQMAILQVRKDVFTEGVRASTEKWRQSVTQNRPSSEATGLLASYYEKLLLLDWDTLSKSEKGKEKLAALKGVNVTKLSYNAYIKFMLANVGNPLKKPSANLLNVLSSLNQTLGILTKAINDFLSLKTTGSDNKDGKK